MKCSDSNACVSFQTDLHVCETQDKMPISTVEWRVRIGTFVQPIHRIPKNDNYLIDVLEQLYCLLAPKPPDGGQSGCNGSSPGKSCHQQDSSPGAWGESPSGTSQHGKRDSTSCVRDGQQSKKVS